MWSKYVLRSSRLTSVPATGSNSSRKTATDADPAILEETPSPPLSTITLDGRKGCGCRDAEGDAVRVGDVEDVAVVVRVPVTGGDALTEGVDTALTDAVLLALGVAVLLEVACAVREPLAVPVLLEVGVVLDEPLLVGLAVPDFVTELVLVAVLLALNVFGGVTVWLELGVSVLLALVDPVKLALGVSLGLLVAVALWLGVTLGDIDELAVDDGEPLFDARTGLSATEWKSAYLFVAARHVHVPSTVSYVTR